MKDIFKNKYSICVLVGIILAACVLIVSITFNVSKSESKKEDTKKYSRYEKEIISIGKKYYEKVYYKMLDNPKEVLKEFDEYGIKIDLGILNNYKEFSTDTTKYLADNGCNYQMSKFILIPKSNYGVKSYDVDINLECSK